MSTDNMQTVVDTAYAAARPHPLDDAGRFWSVVTPGSNEEAGDVKVIDLEDHYEAYRDRPRRKTGTFRVHDAVSFAAYMSKHGLPESEVWADTTASRLVGVINAHNNADAEAEGYGAGWGDHRVEYTVHHTPAWKAWTSFDGKLVDQATFAELIEDRAVDIVRPSAADMLELAQTFQATIGVSFGSSKLLSSGERQLEYRENVDAKAGKAGRLEIPKGFDLALRPFEGADAYKVTARFRYRITDGTLRIGYRLERPEDVLREAFDDVVKHVADNIDAPVLRGVTA